MEVLAFRAARSTFGVAIDEVQEIIDAWSLTRLPLLPDGFAGVTDLRGEPVPVADLSRLVGDGPDGPRRTMIVLRAPSPVALLIDTVEKVVDVDEARPVDLPSVAFLHRRLLSW